MLELEYPSCHVIALFTIHCCRTGIRSFLGLRVFSSFVALPYILCSESKKKDANSLFCCSVYVVVKEKGNGGGVDGRIARLDK